MKIHEKSQNLGPSQDSKPLHPECEPRQRNINIAVSRHGAVTVQRDNKTQREL